MTPGELADLDSMSLKVSVGLVGTIIGAETCCWAEEIPDWLGRLGITCITPTSLLIDYRSVPREAQVGINCISVRSE